MKEASNDAPSFGEGNEDYASPADDAPSFRSAEGSDDPDDSKAPPSFDSNNDKEQKHGEKPEDDSKKDTEGKKEDTGTAS